MNIKDVEFSCSGKKRVPFEEEMDEFYYVSPIENKDEGVLVRLYREAVSSNSVYLEILFLWQALVYPDASDENAVEYVNQNYKQCCDEIYLKELGYSEEEGLGIYIKNNARNAIAHIKRIEKYRHQEIQVDDLDSLRMLSSINYALRDIVRYRFENVFAIGKKEHRLDIFRYYNPREE